MTPPRGSEAVTSFCWVSSPFDACYAGYWVSVHVSAYVIWLYSENSDKFSQKLVGLFLTRDILPATRDPRHGTLAVYLLSTAAHASLPELRLRAKSSNAKKNNRKLTQKALNPNP